METTSFQGLAVLPNPQESPHTNSDKQQPISLPLLATVFHQQNPISPVDSTSISQMSEKNSSEKQTANEKLKRSRERNRVHARKTRQRKKEQMLTLQTRADELKQEQVRLKQCINEKNTASILVGLFATAGEKDVGKQAEDPRIETLLKRSAEDIPDASKITELPALILPGQHNSKKAKAFEALQKESHPDDGIDYQLLGKDRSKCTPEELDKIRRERNRMHAKRTRDRKRLFMEEMSDMCKQLEEENNLLRNHLKVLEGDCPSSSAFSAGQIPELKSSTTGETPAVEGSDSKGGLENKHVMMDQLKTLIEVAGSFENKNKPNALKGMLSLSAVASSAATTVSASDSNNSSTNNSVNHDHDDSSREEPLSKRRRLENDTGVSLGVPHSITASSLTAV